MQGDAICDQYREIASVVTGTASPADVAVTQGSLFAEEAVRVTFHEELRKHLISQNEKTRKARVQVSARARPYS